MFVQEAMPLRVASLSHWPLSWAHSSTSSHLVFSVVLANPRAQAWHTPNVEYVLVSVFSPCGLPHGKQVERLGAGPVPARQAVHEAWVSSTTLGDGHSRHSIPKLEKVVLTQR